MAFSAEISFAPANELILSFYTFQCKKAHKRLELGTNWVTETTRKLTKPFAAEIKELDNWDDCGQLKLLVWQCPHKETAEQFLTWLKSLSAGEMYERLSPWIKNFPEDLGVVRDRSVHFLSEWNQQYFGKLDASIIEGLQADAAQKQKMQKILSPVELAETATNGLRFTESESDTLLLLSPQFHHQPATLVHAYEGITVCQYAASELPVLEPGELSPVLYRLTKALADKTRLKLLRYLRTGPKSFMEIVTYMGMAKSTIHEHMLNLRTAGLVRGHVAGDSVSSYELRPEGFDILQEQLAQYLNAPM